MTNTAHYCAEQCTRSGALRSSLRISDRYGSYSAHCKNIRQTESIWSITVNFISCLICMIRVFFIHTLFSDKSQGINSCSSSRTTSGMGLQFQFVGFERMENFRSTKKSAIDYWFPIKSVFFTESLRRDWIRAPVLVISYSRRFLSLLISPPLPHF